MPTYTILLAEDNPINQTLLLRFLSKQGHAVTVAGNGQIALDAWQKAPFDIILMDVMMPDMDGLEATRAIRAAEATRGGHIPILAITANAMEGDREICLAAGMDDYLSKPVKLDQLIVKMDEVIGTLAAK